ncbi:MAG: hypothetical protein P8L45_07935 [Longimicrobiales bacterium]|nr:hypothetical protein [Longimicrobiales bacterium]
MIIRAWRATTTRDGDDQYRDAVRRVVLDHLSETPGYRGAIWMRKEDGDHWDYWVLTCWDSMNVVTSFAGDDPNTAWVPDEIRVALEKVGVTVEHYELALGHDLERLLGSDSSWDRVD